MSERIKFIFKLHILLMVYSLSGVCSKLAANEALFSNIFFIYYACIIALLGLYAFGWQQIIKKMPLSTAYANKAITVIWGLIWGTVFFNEKLTFGKVFSALVIVTGVILYVKADEPCDGNHE